MGGGGERDEQGTKTAGRLDNREGDLDEQAAAADEDDEEQVRTKAGQHCCCPASSLASRYVKYNKSTVIK